MPIDVAVLLFIVFAAVFYCLGYNASSATMKRYLAELREKITRQIELSNEDLSEVGDVVKGMRERKKK